MTAVVMMMMAMMVVLILRVAVTKYQKLGGLRPYKIDSLTVLEGGNLKSRC